ncbi:MAG TPA: hypothetical protein ENF67_01615 [Candidatus Pacearchaeota archaeon]|nr:MAG: hypothetical protein B6U82_01645 [Candidatus Pacearchaeota archaeon ex4484_31]HDI03217.1 hypothetical protein [Candidatus Pacearchaeota archaeon]
MRAKFILGLISLIIFVVSAVGLLISYNIDVGFLKAFPEKPEIYFIIVLVLSLVGLGSSVKTM